MTDDESLKWEGDREEGIKFEEELKITRQVSFMREEEGRRGKWREEWREEEKFHRMKQQLRSDEVSVMSAFAFDFRSFLCRKRRLTWMNRDALSVFSVSSFLFLFPAVLIFCLSSSLLDSCVMTWEREEKRGWKRERGWKEEIDRQRERQATSSCTHS